MRRVVFDIETAGCDFKSLDHFSQDYFLRFAESEEQREEARRSLSFYPLTGEIVAIAMMDVDTGKGAVYFQNGEEEIKYQEGGFVFISACEHGILEHFWRQLRRFDQFITFNGRLFDGPFIMVRSAVLNIQVERQLVPYRYSTESHVDLADQLTFYGAARRAFPLHMWCRAFGIPSPKAEGISGLNVQELFKSGHFRDIAHYCKQDVLATAELFRLWEKYINK